MNSVNAETLAEVIHIVQSLQSATPDGRRAELLSRGPDGVSAFDKIVRQRRRTDVFINASPWLAVDLLGGIGNEVSDDL